MDSDSPSSERASLGSPKKAIAYHLLAGGTKNLSWLSNNYVILGWDMTTRIRLLVFLAILACCYMSTSSVHAEWSSDPSVNNAISIAVGYQYNPAIISDGSGGVVIAWADTRSNNGHIYAQRINANGVVLWTVNGVAISSTGPSPHDPTIISDSNGGAIIIWQENRSGTNGIYAQRINANGEILWPADGIAFPVSIGVDYVLYFPKFVSDGNGGAICTWQDNRSGNWDIYAQRVDGSGAVQWTTDGVAIVSREEDQDTPSIISDGSGGAIITWQDKRVLMYDYQIFAQRINASGVVQWSNNGVGMSNFVGKETNPQIASDGNCGAIITWQQYNQGSGQNGGYSWDIKAQRVNADGVLQWGPNGSSFAGADICWRQDDQVDPRIIIDGVGGAVITWRDYRNNNSYEFYAQRINKSGLVQWTQSGVPFPIATGIQNFPQMVVDGSGGAIISWQDNRSGQLDIYAQHLDANGVVQWGLNGAVISTAADDQSNPTITSDGTGGAIIAWYDSRSGNWDIYAQRVNTNGTLTPIVIKGDVNNDGQVDLTDGILSLQVVCGISPANIHLSADLNEDGKIGVVETFHALRLAAEVSEVFGVKSLSSGGAHSLVLINNDTVWAWGGNSYGQLGDGSTADSCIPVYIGD